MMPRIFIVAPVAAMLAGASVTVRRGDTVYGIARKYRADPKEIISDNGLKAPYALRVGQKLKVEKAPSAPGSGPKIRQVYVVSPGETVYGISRKFEVPPATLVALNGIKNNSLSVGQRLKIPETGASAAGPKPQETAVEKPDKAAPADPPKRTFAFSGLPGIGRPESRDGGAFAWPVVGSVLQRFGSVSKGQSNDGINISAAFGDGVRASENGVVAYAGTLKSFGNLVLVKHADGFITAYGHNDKLLVARGERVKKGQVIALVGSTGAVDRPQVHFEIRKGTKAVDPMIYLKK